MLCHLRRERGQALPIIALLIVVLIALIGFAIDVGRLYVAQTELSRAVDSAALAGVVELPDVNDAHSMALSYLNENVPDATASFPIPSDSSELRVKGSRSVDMIFMSLFGFGSIDLDVTAAAGGGGRAREIVFVLDDTGSMNEGCNGSQSNSGCPIRQAKDAAHAFLDSLDGTDIRIGIIPFRGCYGDQRYDPLGGGNPRRGCVLLGDILDLTNDQGALHGAINNLSAAGGTGTNVCTGLNEALKMVATAGSGANVDRVVVVLTDGSNEYAQGAESSQRGNPPPNTYPPPGNSDIGECIPSGYPQDSRGYGSDYDARVGALDVMTNGKADALKGQGVEIYVAGYSVSGGAPNGSACSPGSVGGGSARQGNGDTYDRNLNRCLASSAPGTNDHYFEALRPEDIPQIFEEILRSITFRLVE
jgi:hypothetical protein